jgi:hypothetical protein
MIPVLLKKGELDVQKDDLGSLIPVFTTGKDTQDLTL